MRTVSRFLTLEARDGGYLSYRATHDRLYLPPNSVGLAVPLGVTSYMTEIPIRLLANRIDTRIMRRRSPLCLATAVGAAGIAGCSALTGNEVGGTGDGPVATLRMDPVTPAEITERVYGKMATDITERAAIVEEAVANGTATVEEQRPPLRDGERVVYEGTLYEMTMTVETREPATLYPIALENLSHENLTPAPDAERVRFEDLPEIDREVFRANNLAEGELLGIGTSLVYTDAEAERSALVPPAGYTIIEWESGARGQFSLHGDAHDTHLSTYRYTVDIVAESAAAYGRDLRERYALDLSDVPSAEADILRAAATGGDEYRVTPDSTPTNAFQSLVDRFRGEQDITHVDEEGEEDEGGRGRNPDRYSGTYLVRFEGQVYWTRVFVDTSDNE